MLKFYSLFFLLTCNLYGFSQQNTVTRKYSADEIRIKSSALKGTYQFQVWNEKMRYYFTTETFILIEELRQENSDTTLKLNPMTDVFIPSRKKINSPDFKPLPEYHYK